MLQLFPDWYQMEENNGALRKYEGFFIFEAHPSCITKQNHKFKTEGNESIYL